MSGEISCRHSLTMIQERYLSIFILSITPHIFVQVKITKQKRKDREDMVKMEDDADFQDGISQPDRFFNSPPHPNVALRGIRPTNYNVLLLLSQE